MHIAADSLLLIGHGTRDRAGQEEFATVVRQVADAAPRLLVAGANLEFVAPDIETATRELYARGARRIVAAPLLLFAAGHVRRDIPAALAKAGEQCPGLAVTPAPHLGCHPALVELSARRFVESLSVSPPFPLADTLLLFVGRGSLDATANAEVARFARLRWEHTPLGWLETCYLAMTQPSLERGLEVAAGLPFRRVVVQPHLLFQGDLLERVAAAVGAAQDRWPAREWAVTTHLGPDPLVAQAVLERAGLAAPAGNRTLILPRSDCADRMG